MLFSFYLVSLNSMGKLSKTERYIMGKDRTLDKMYLAYKKMNLWREPVLSQALGEEEIDTLAELWRKEKLGPWRLSVQEVSTLVAGFSLYFRKNGNIIALKLINITIY